MVDTVINPIEHLRKKLLYQSWYRGCKETDRIIGTFARLYLSAFTEPELRAFAAILEESDGDLFDWLTDKKPMPLHLKQCPVMQRLKAFDYSKHV